MQKCCFSRALWELVAPRATARWISEPLCPSHHYFLWEPCLLEQWRLSRRFTSRCVDMVLIQRQGLEQQDPSFIAGGNSKWRSHFGRQFGTFLQSYIVFPYKPGIMLLSIYPVDLKRCVHTKTCVWMFRAAVFLIVKNWKELRCPSLGEWINYGSSILQSVGQELKKKKKKKKKSHLAAKMRGGPWNS